MPFLSIPINMEIFQMPPSHNPAPLIQPKAITLRSLQLLSLQ